MRLIYFGTPDFASRCLRKILLSKHIVAAIVTAPDRPAGRGRRILQPSVKKLSLSHGLMVLQPEKFKAPVFLDQLRSFNAELFCVVAFKILPPEVFLMPPAGCINLHASLLPRYRGAAPINWAIINGDSETGLTTFFIQQQVDSGEIILQQKISIGSDESFGELHDRMAETGGDLLIKSIDLIESGRARPFKQDGTHVSLAPKLAPGMGLIDWSKDAPEIHNLVRGLSPRPSAYSFLLGKRVSILKTRLVDGERQKGPGEILFADPGKRMVVSCGSGDLEILELKPESGKPMSGASFVRGYRLKTGERFQNQSVNSSPGEQS